MVSRAIAILLVLGPASVLAQHQHSPYAGMEAREVTSLSSGQIAELRTGRGMGASLPAELNGVPGPLHVLELKDRLQLSGEQRVALKRISSEMTVAAQRLGGGVIDAEAALDRGFRNGTADQRFIEAATRRIGELNAELRAVHLVAHLKTKALLSEKQIDAYSEARGYAPTASSSHRP